MPSRSTDCHRSPNRSIRFGMVLIVKLPGSRPRRTSGPLERRGHRGARMRTCALRNVGPVTHFLSFTTGARLPEIKKRYHPRGAIDLFGTREALDAILFLIVPKPILRVTECVSKVGSIFRGIVTIGFGVAQLKEQPI